MGRSLSGRRTESLRSAETRNRGGCTRNRVSYAEEWVKASSCGTGCRRMKLPSFPELLISAAGDGTEDRHALAAEHCRASRFGRGATVRCPPTAKGCAAQADCRLPTADCRLPTASLAIPHYYKTPTLTSRRLQVVVREQPEARAHHLKLCGFSMMLSGGRASTIFTVSTDTVTIRASRSKIYRGSPTSRDQSFGSLTIFEVESAFT